MSQINAEFGRGNNLNAYRGTTWYTDAGGSGTFSSGAISMSEFYGKRASPAFTVGYSAGFTNNYTVEHIYNSGNATGVGIRWNTNGTMDQFDYDTGYNNLYSTWGSPTTTGAGNNYYIRFTRTAVGGPNASSSSTASTGWMQMNSGREITLQRFPVASTMQATYTVEISSSSSGSPVLSTRTGITLVTTNAGI